MDELVTSGRFGHDGRYRGVCEGRDEAREEEPAAGYWFGPSTSLHSSSSADRRLRATRVEVYV